MKKNLVSKLITGSAAMMAAVFVLSGNALAAEDTDVVSNGVFIGATDVSGMTVADVRNLISSQVSAYDNVTFTFDGGYGNTITAKGSELGLHLADEEIADKAAEYGKKGTPLERFIAKKNNALGVTKTFDFDVEANYESVRSIIELNESKLEVEPVDNSLERVNGQFVYHEGTPGVKVDIDASAATVCDYITDQWNGADCTIAMTTIVDEPNGSSEDLALVSDVLGTYTTSYSSSGANRCANIKNATSFIDGTVLFPGEEFSVYDTIQPFTAENGYELAGSYENGQTVETYGGGICQVSTTLYNAVLYSELEVVERYNHSMIVNYVSPSRDAAIAGTAKNFRFKNNTDYPIYIEGYTEGKQVTFNIYGHETRDANRTVEYESETLETTPYTAQIVLDGAQGVGFIGTSAGHTGYKAKLWKVVYENGTEVSRTEFNSSTYKMSPKTLTVGVAGLGGEQLAALQAAAAAGDEATVRAYIGAWTAH